MSLRCVFASIGIVREFPPGLEVFMENKGMELLLHCLVCEYEKVIIKALFLLRSISNKTVSSYITGITCVCSVCVCVVCVCSVVCV